MPTIPGQNTGQGSEGDDNSPRHQWTRRRSVSRPAETAQISQLRCQGAELLKDCVPDQHLYNAMESDAKLLITEIATNAIVHGKAPSLTLTLATSNSAVRFSLTGQTEALPSRHRRQEALATAESGRGLKLVSALAAAWGADSENGVWFVLTIPQVS